MNVVKVGMRLFLADRGTSRQPFDRHNLYTVSKHFLCGESTHHLSRDDSDVAYENGDIAVNIEWNKTRRIDD